MSEIWRVDIEDTTGAVVATIKNFQYLSFETKISRRGAFRLQIHDDEDVRTLLDLDYLARVWYKNETYSIDWTNVFNGILKTPTRVWYSNGNKLTIWYGSDSNELLDKALVMYPISDQTRAYKNDTASTVLAEYIEENIGASALVAQGRFVDHVNPVTVVQPSPAVGPVWEGNMGHDILTKALQAVRSFSHEQDDRVDYEVRYVENYVWEAHVGKIFTDRTINGLYAATGLNGAGNVPVILSPLYGNVKQYTESTPRVQESNTILALGQRVGEDREFVIAQDATSIAASPIAQRESMAQSQNQVSNITDLAESALDERVGRQGVLIEPKFSDAFALFRDLIPGDFFTVVALDRSTVNKQVVELKAQVQQTKGGRTISQYTLFTETREP
jgi:hypothetical protein